MHFYTFFPKEYDDMQSDFFDDAIVIMIDVLRASTTICASFFNGTKEVIPFVSPKEAYNYYLNREDKENYILSGEINLELPKGFMLGNSPNENKKDISYSVRSGCDCCYIWPDADLFHKERSLHLKQER